MSPKPIFAVWVGAGSAVSEIFNRAGIAHYATETEAVRGFNVARQDFDRDGIADSKQRSRHRFRLSRVTRHLCRDNRNRISTKQFGAFERIKPGAAFFESSQSWWSRRDGTDRPPGQPRPIRNNARFRNNAKEFRCVLSGQIRDGNNLPLIHKSDVGGVRLNLVSGQAVHKAALEIIARARTARPDARIAGVTIQPMIVRPKARELIAGIADDPTFGPVVVFGHGGTAVEVINDKALGLPPLDLKLAHDLVERTRVSRLLHAYRDVPEARVVDIALVLVKLAQLVADVPEVRELDINPLLADETGVLALDARIAVTAEVPKFKGRGHPRFAVRPYPSDWERRLVLDQDWGILVRPVRPEDEGLVRAFFQKVSQEDLRLRFFAAVKDLGHIFIARLTQLDYARAIAFIAIDEASGEMIGGVRLHADANYETGEFAILMRSDLKGRGLGWKLMELIIEYARAEGIKRIAGQVLRENTVMLRMCSEFGFGLADDPQDACIFIASLSLSEPK